MKLIAIAVAMVIAGISAVGMVGGTLVLSMFGSGPQSAGCEPTMAPAPTTSGPAGSQVSVAATIMAVASQLGLSARDQQIGIMTALGESDLGADPTSTKPNGDGDSGIFQQRTYVGWYADGHTQAENIAILNDPAYAARTFYLGHDVAVAGPSPAGPIGYHIPGLVDVKGRETLAPTLAANRTQRNADPNHYAKYWDRAGVIMTAAGGVSAPPPAVPNVACVGTSKTSGGTAGGNGIVGAVNPNCPGGDISGYANGQIPISLLCPLWGVKDHHLRADAANAFNQMSQAYAAQFGSPICVTDSYRPYSVQVSLKASKPGLAATPGKSNHGWAKATDLCGGIQNFGGAPHVWMQQNAPKFGWCDPPWSRAGGSKPEPWHWEYGGC